MRLRASLRTTVLLVAFLVAPGSPLLAAGQVHVPSGSWDDDSGRDQVEPKVDLTALAARCSGEAFNSDPSLVGKFVGCEKGCTEIHSGYQCHKSEDAAKWKAAKLVQESFNLMWPGSNNQGTLDLGWWKRCIVVEGTHACKLIGRVSFPE